MDERFLLQPHKPPQQRVAERLKVLLRESAAGTAALSASVGLFLGCDPMPMPAFTCSKTIKSTDLFKGVSAYASWRDLDAGAKTVQAAVGFYSSGGQKTTFPADPHITGGTFTKITRDGSGSIQLEFVPDAGATTVDVEFHVDCDTNQVLMRLRFDLSKAEEIAITAIE